MNGFYKIFSQRKNSTSKEINESSFIQTGTQPGFDLSVLNCIPHYFLFPQH